MRVDKSYMLPIEDFKKLIDSVKNILITTHIHPDADGVGSQISLCYALEYLGKNVMCVNEEPLDDRYKYLDVKNVLTDYKSYIKNPLESIDLFIVADTNSLPRIGKSLQELVLYSKNLLFIDHHPCPPEMATIHCIDTTKAATGELVGNLIEHLEVPFTKEIALPLYTAILIDTSSFRYPTVTGDTHALVAKLMSTGISPPEAFNLINGTKKIGHMKLLGKVLNTTKTNKDETIAWITLSEKMISEHGCDLEDTHGFINQLLILDEIKVVCMFREVGKLVKISMRSTVKNIDVGVLAQALGGGGHNHSAATVLEGEIEEISKNTIKKIEKMIAPKSKDHLPRYS